MNDQDRTHSDMIAELESLRSRVAELESRGPGDRTAEEECTRNKECYHLLFDANPQPMWVYDLKTLSFLAVNNAALSKYGYSREEFLAMTIADIRPPEDVTRLLENVAKVTDGLDEAGVWRHRKKDGSIVNVEIVSHTLTFEGRKAELVLAHDITELRRTIKALRESEDRLKFMVSNSPAVIYTCRPSGDFGATFVSPNVVYQLGYESEEFVSDPGFWAAQVHPDDAPRVFDGLGILFTTGAHSHEYRFRHKDGTWRWMHDELKLIRNEDGEPAEILGSWVDITERKKMEEALSESEQRYRTLFETMAQGVIYQNSDGLIISANPAAERILGISYDQMLGLTSMDPHWRSIREDGSDFHGSQHPSMESLRTGRPVRDVIMGIFHPVLNEYRWILVNASPQFLPGGKTPYQVYTTFTDITESRKAAESLQTAKEYAENLIETANTIVVGLDTAGNITVFNRAAEKITGYSRSELQNRSWFEVLVPKERYPHVWEEFERLMDGGLPEHFENPIVTKSGDERYIAWQNNQVYVRGDITGTISFGMDITERRQAEEELQESEEKFRSVFDSASDGILLVDPLTKRFVLGNATISRMLGVRQDDLPGMRVEDIHPAEALQAVFQAFEKVAKGEALYSENIPVLRKDGSVFFADIATSWIKLSGASYMAGFFRDITERKQTEQQRLEMERRLLHAQKLESLGVLAGGIAHDFNNLLMAILGNLDLALLRIAPLSPARDNIEESIRAVQRATDLTRQMLAYSGRGSFIVRPMDLNELVEENARLLRAAIARTATLNVQLGKQLPLIEADAGQVQQVIMNLLTNASEAIGDKSGVISLSTGVETCSAQRLKQSRIEDVPPAGRFVYVEVSDTGMGMDEGTKQRLFDPFFTTKTTGRGLGMSAILGIVRGHHGVIFIDSEEGRGTSIRVLFPVLESAEATQTAVDSASTAEVSSHELHGTILLVDDEDAVRAVCKDMLEYLGWTVLTASDGMEALSLFRERSEEIPFVIVDLTMPVMDGIKTFGEILRIRPDAKVILSSGYDKLDSIGQFQGHGIAGFIQKPYTLDNLKRTLATVAKQ